MVEKELETFGVDAVTTAERLDAFHRVENTYLSTFQALGGLGLLLGTIGLAAVMFRNVLERRRELALLRAVGYNARNVTQMILAEAVLLLGAGLAAGALCAAIAIAPAWLGHGGRMPGSGLILLLLAVVRRRAAVLVRCNARRAQRPDAGRVARRIVPLATQHHATAATSCARRRADDSFDWCRPGPGLDQLARTRTHGCGGGFTPPASWPERPKQVWKVPAGIGHSSPVVSGDRVYLFSRVVEQEALTAFDLRLASRSGVRATTRRTR